VFTVSVRQKFIDGYDLTCIDSVLEVWSRIETAQETVLD